MVKLYTRVHELQADDVGGEAALKPRSAPSEVLTVYTKLTELKFALSEGGFRVVQK